ncbi:MAG: phosphohydrolase [Rhodospirillaceae bacterium]|nr:phosphohydrolase [Rhodospirillaceae bacterium]
MARIETEQQLREIYKEPAGRAVIKQTDRLEVHSKRFLALSPFCLLATNSAAGGTDVSPRGEEPGFVQAIDDLTVALPDRPGNNRIDSFRNIIANPDVGLIFLIPGVNETLRINGHAEIRDDEDLMARFVINGKLPKSVMLISIREVFLHCAKALVRSQLWDPSAQIARSDLPPTSRMIADMAGEAGTDLPQESQEEMARRQKEVLY